MDVAGVVHVEATVPYPGIDAQFEEERYRASIVDHFIFNESSQLMGLSSDPISDATEFKALVAQRDNFENFNGNIQYPTDEGSCMFLRNLIATGPVSAADFWACFGTKSESGSDLSRAWVLCDEAAHHCLNPDHRLKVTALCPHVC